MGQADVNQELLKNEGGGGSGGCDPRIKAIVKLKSRE